MSIGFWRGVAQENKIDLGVATGLRWGCDGVAMGCDGVHLDSSTYAHMATGTETVSSRSGSSGIQIEYHQIY